MLRLQSRITFIPKPADMTLLDFATDPYIKDPDRDVIEFDDFVNDVEIKSSFKNLTDTATIVIPRKLKWKEKPLIDGLHSIIKRDDKVKIELGYYTNGTQGLRLVFDGFVKRLVPNAPITIECEDYMFAVKDILFTFPPNSQRELVTTSKKGRKLKHPFIKGTKTYNLSTLLSNLLDYDDIPWINLAGDVECGSILWTNVKGGKVLDGLRGGTLGYYLYSYFIQPEVADYIMKNVIPNNPNMTYSDILKTRITSPVLCVGFQSNVFAGNLSNDNQPETFNFEYNMIDDSNLFYMFEKDINLNVKGISLKSNLKPGEKNEKVTYQYPEHETGGDLVTFHDSCNQTLDQLKLHTIEFYKNFAYTGYRGSFLTFGEPYVNPGDKVKLVSDKYPEKNGTYLVYGVDRSFGMNGYRQNIELGTQTEFNKNDGTILPKQSPPNTLP